MFRGLNFPCHFMVGVYGWRPEEGRSPLRGHKYVDPFNKYTVMDAEGVHSFAMSRGIVQVRVEGRRSELLRVGCR